MKLSLHEAIIRIRVELQNSNIKKSGFNKFAGFKYFELSDFLPKLNELMLKYNVNDVFTITEDKAILTLIKDDERQDYTMPFKLFEVPKNKSGQPQMQEIQYLGALNTYIKRYLYMNAFGITDGEIIDAMPITQGNIITDEQLNTLNELIEITGTDKNKMLAYFKVSDLNKIDVATFDKMIKALNKKLEHLKTDEIFNTKVENINKKDKK